MRAIILRKLPLLTAVAVVFLAGCTAQQSLIPPDPDRLELVEKVQGQFKPIPKQGAPVQIRPRAWWDNTRPNAARLKYMGKITRMTIHHEGLPTANNEMSLDGVIHRLRATRRVHAEHLHWADIGYHFCIDRAGRIWEARSIRYQGAHAGNNAMNKGNIGVELLGNFNKQKVNSAQKKSLRWLIVKLMGDYDIPVCEIYTHREIRQKYHNGATECPGEDLQKYMCTLRAGLGG